LLYAIGVHLDMLADWIVDGVKRRFPRADAGLTAADSIPMLGRERGIRRGHEEPDSVYAPRLERWWDAHAHRGGPYELLRQIHDYYAAAPFPVTLVYYSGRRFDMAADGTITRGLATGADAWPPDADSARWGRWWLFYRWPDDLGDRNKWGDGGRWGDGRVWGGSTALTHDLVADLRLIPTEWNAAHTKGQIVLTDPDSTSIDLADSGVKALVAIP
jgi:hypothetical protein